MEFDEDMILAFEKISESPIQKGTIFCGKFISMASVEYEYSDLFQDRLIEHAVRMPFGQMHHRFEFFPADEALH